MGGIKVMNMPRRDLTLMAVHAHPDDEATSTGGVLAKYAAEGVRTVLVTCTDGRCGDGPDGVKPGEPGHDVDAVVAMRKGELEASCAILNITHLELLGYADSGMEGWAQNSAPGSFWSTPLAEATDRLADLIRQYRPDVVVTYDENGFYGHPDHIQAHRITMAAVEQTGIPAKVYWTTLPYSTMVTFGEILRASQPDSATPDPDNGADDTGGDTQPPTETTPFGLPDDEISTWVDTRAFGRQKYAAISAHASQSDATIFLDLGVDRLNELTGIETFSRAKDNTGASLPEDDLFAGLPT
jgi:LmbE family N-acetylglucosaminyl deacetylase